MKITKKAHLKHKGTLFTIPEKAAAVLEKWTRFFRLAAVLYVFRSKNVIKIVIKIVIKNVIKIVHKMS